ncbi:DnaJ domain-containing protein [Arboricoccus pini]|uniref:DnaJ domain-containing protein n=1 Tax=Arboricoccus pini TaxID=1963835 RepID=A0A212RTZ4_9PROT|nr:DnaJ domain-containing protein [Arboricoccus pini]SNB75992.1 DnaJ domain-containing protein [Arboricoccus pini]
MTQERQTSSVDDHLRFPWREQRLADGRRCCAWPDCHREASFRAPKSRTELRAFVWFCLDHVREYNKAWNYFLGMSQEEIDAYRRSDVTWHRPTWRFGSAGNQQGPRWYDPFGFMGEEEPQAARSKPPPPEDKPGEMRRLLELEVGFTLTELKTAYKAMVKRYHPDLHAGDKAFEERLKLVIEAYRYLKDNELYLGA